MGLMLYFSGKAGGPATAICQFPPIVLKIHSRSGLMSKRSIQAARVARSLQK
jgi:hypothetical protein